MREEKRRGNGRAGRASFIRRWIFLEWVGLVGFDWLVGVGSSEKRGNFLRTCFSLFTASTLWVTGSGRWRLGGSSSTRRVLGLLGQSSCSFSFIRIANRSYIVVSHRIIIIASRVNCI